MKVRRNAGSWASGRMNKIPGYEELESKLISSAFIFGLITLIFAVGAFYRSANWAVGISAIAMLISAQVLRDNRIQFKRYYSIPPIVRKL
jgi:hypothetical protein